MTWDWVVQRTGKYCSIRCMEYLEFQTGIFGRMESAPHFRCCKWGYLFFGQKETGAERVAMPTPLRVSLCFVWDAHLWCQVSSTLLQYFQRYRLFSILPFLVATEAYHLFRVIYFWLQTI